MKKIPKFKSEKEEADFWAAHNSTDYLSVKHRRSPKGLNVNRLCSVSGCM